MSLPNFRARTMAENQALMERSRLAPVKPPAYATPQDMARAIDAAIEHGRFYTQAAQDALAGLTILRDQLAAQSGDRR
jgi:acyl-CoA synthetase (NDP forming)